jgi:hypothetical protein
MRRSYLRYVVAGCCFTVAAILIAVSSNSQGGRNDCRNWYARSVASLFIPCAAKAEQAEPFNIGTPLTDQQGTRAER